MDEELKEIIAELKGKDNTSGVEAVYKTIVHFHEKMLDVKTSIIKEVVKPVKKVDGVMVSPVLKGKSDEEVFDEELKSLFDEGVGEN